MNIIDAHHHLWDLEKLNYPWLNDPEGEAIFGDYSAIRRNYLLEEYLKDCRKQGVVKSVHVQAEHDKEDPVAESRWLQSIADKPDSEGFPHAIVAYADLCRDDLEGTLEAHCEYPNVRGIRQLLNFHPDPKLTYTSRPLLDDERLWKNFKLLKRFNLSFDLHLYYQQMAQAATLARENSDTLIILDHAGVPVERDEAGLAGWREGMRVLSECDNIVAKISGLGMCDPHWTIESLRPFVLQTLDFFGVERCMFASNFPVDKIFSDYGTLVDAYKTILAELSVSEQQQFFHDNAVRYYRLESD